MKLLAKLSRDTRGLAAVEMGLVLTLISLGVVGAVTVLGTETSNSFNTTANKVAEATPR